MASTSGKGLLEGLRRKVILGPDVSGERPYLSCLNPILADEDFTQVVGSNLTSRR